MVRYVLKTNQIGIDFNFIYIFKDDILIVLEWEPDGVFYQLFDRAGSAEGCGVDMGALWLPLQAHGETVLPE